MKNIIFYINKLFLSKPNIISNGTKIKYKDDNGNYKYGVYIRDTLFRGEYSALSLFLDVISIIKDDEIGRIKIEKKRLIVISNFK